MLIAVLLALMLDEPGTGAAAKAAAPPAPATQRADPTPAAPQPAPPGLPVPGSPVTPGLQLPPLSTSAPSPDLRAVWRNHPSLRAGDLFRVDFAAKFQLDSRDAGDDPSDFNAVEVHRMRLGIEGTLFRHIEYQVERELTERETFDPEQKTTKTPWKDVYLEANYSSAAQVRVGKFKVPYGLDELTSETERDFIYRSLGARYLSPGRDVGAMVHGRLLGRRLNYSTGVFKQDGENARTSKIEGAARTVAARLTVSPRGRRPGPELGASIAVSDLANDSFYPNGLRGRTAVSQYVFFDPVYVNGQRRRVGADADWTFGPFAARAEYMLVTDTRDQQGLGSQDLVDVRGQAWYASASWVVTGEKKDRPVEPRHGGLFRGGFGAIELAARYDRLRFDSADGGAAPARTTRAATVYPNADHVVTLGLNYYANRWMKVQWNAIRERLDDIERSATPDRFPFWSSVLRLQLEL